MFALRPAVSAIRRGVRFQQLLSSSTQQGGGAESSPYDVLICGGGITGATLAAKLLRMFDGCAAGSGLRIALLDSREPRPVTAGSRSSKSGEDGPPDLRVYAISPQSINTLKSIGAWPEHRNQPFHAIQVWESGGPGLLRFSSSDGGVDMLGSVAEDSHILRCIYRSIDETNAERSSVAIGQGDHGQGSGRVDYLFNNDVHAITHRASDNSSVVDIIDRKTGMKKVINARLIVGADGPQSTVRRLGGISTWGWGYGQEAIVCTVQTPSSLAAHFSGGSNNVVTRSAFQKYLSGGPLAILPLWDGFSSIVWSTQSAEAARLLALSDDDFLDELNAAFRTDANQSYICSSSEPISVGANTILGLFDKYVVKEAAAIAETVVTAATLTGAPFEAPPSVTALSSKRASFPLSLQKAQSYYKRNIVLVGDAAHTIHPQAGQGLNLGIADVELLSRLVEQAISRGVAINDDSLVLARYAGERYAKNLAMMAAVDGLQRIFNDSHPVSAVYDDGSRKSDATKIPLSLKRLARSSGMLLLHASGRLLRERLAKFAMGLNIT